MKNFLRLLKSRKRLLISTPSLEEPMQKFLSPKFVNLTTRRAPAVTRRKFQCCSCGYSSLGGEQKNFVQTPLFLMKE